MGYAQKGEGDYGDVSLVPLGSKESHAPPIRWLRAKSLYSIMIEYKMSEMKSVGGNGLQLADIIAWTINRMDKIDIKNTIYPLHIERGK